VIARPLLAASVLLTAFAAAAQTIDEFLASNSTNPVSGGPNFRPVGIAAGPDGNLWYAEQVAAIGRITTSGLVTEFPVPSFFCSPTFITVGPDGNLWFSEENCDIVGRITAAGVITEFYTPSANSQPHGLTGGPDGNVWFVEYEAGKIGRITPSGSITEFGVNYPYAYLNNGIVNGPDGNLWFGVNSALPQTAIGRMTPSGVQDFFPIPGKGGPGMLAVGPDGNIWFPEILANKIGKITPAGVITDYPLSAPFVSPIAITAGPDGNLWFTDDSKNVGTITTSGSVIRALAAPSRAVGMGFIAAGSDGNIWFTVPLITGYPPVGEICRVNIAAPVPTIPTEGTFGLLAFAVALALFGWLTASRAV
jgi:streptogramin lyase